MVDPVFRMDPEDQLADVIQSMTTGEKEIESSNTFKAEREAMDIADMIVNSIQSCAKELWPKLAQNLILCGGVGSTPNLITQVEDLVFQKLSKDVDCVEILLINVQ
jgi:actin-related protein